VNSSMLEEQSLFDEADLPDLPVDETTILKRPEPIEPENDANDFSEDFELIEELIGTESTMKIAKAFAGSTIYVPKNISKNKTYCDIRRKYRAGATYRELSGEYNYTETHIRNIIHRGKK